MLRRCPGFNGLLIGQGTAGTAHKCCGSRVNVSMASSSAKALPEFHDRKELGKYKRFNGLLIGQGTAGVRSESVSSVQARFQWPPHRPRHCRKHVANELTNLAEEFQWPPHRPRHCRILAQGFRARRRCVSMASSSAKALPVFDSSVPGTVNSVSMASSSAKALPVAPEHLAFHFQQSFNGLLIGQGTAGVAGSEPCGLG